MLLRGDALSVKIVPHGSPSARGSPVCSGSRVLRVPGDSGDGVPVSAGQLCPRGAAVWARHLQLPGGWGGAGRWSREQGLRGETQSRCLEGWGPPYSVSLSVQFTTTVVSCRPAELQTEGSNGKKEVLSGFQVVLEDTLLFPEGGGQVPGPRLTPTRSQEAPHSFLLRKCPLPPLPQP